MELTIATAATLIDALNAAEEYTAEHSDTAMIYDTTRQLVIHTEEKKETEKMKAEPTEPPIVADSLDELRAIHEARMDYCEAQDCCWEDSAE